MKKFMVKLKYETGDYSPWYQVLDARTPESAVKKVRKEADKHNRHSSYPHTIDSFNPVSEVCDIDKLKANLEADIASLDREICNIELVLEFVKEQQRDKDKQLFAIRRYEFEHSHEE